ncbi:Rieske 2Fe-2S domain-containing protein [Bradyrhizobium pachyrhizi]|uniref:Rieske (2Fe-2S) protein n=1 Tax=Bradyrhizobium pachyrhizi TaxID=280333 RepID=UPI0024B1D386|nr:Rieske 2Fe-2S domain-containing protein [Bradyrhizobium pachyrhizi]WFU54712.1 Rieske 2Fe-2S domain-containing protein [Bradyrhizobium pachyrhizi]
MKGLMIMTKQEVQPNTVYAICGFNDIPSRRAMGFHLMIVGEDGKHRPWSIIVVRWGKKVLGYLNKCPHNDVNLDWERNEFLDPFGTRLMCGKHGSTFELGTGRCVDGPCKGRELTPVALTVLDGDICVIGVRLAEEDRAGES